MEEITITFSEEEMEALQSICCTADLSRITEGSMPGVARFMAKVYSWERNRGYFFNEGGE